MNEWKHRVDSAATNTYNHVDIDHWDQQRISVPHIPGHMYAQRCVRINSMFMQRIIYHREYNAPTDVWYIHVRSRKVPFSCTTCYHKHGPKRTGPFFVSLLWFSSSTAAARNRSFSATLKSLYRVFTSTKKKVPFSCPLATKRSHF